MTEEEAMKERQRLMALEAVELAEEHGHPGGDPECERFSCWILRQPAGKALSESQKR